MKTFSVAVGQIEKSTGALSTERLSVSAFLFQRTNFIALSLTHLKI